MSKQYYVYILTSKRNGTLYAGMTSNLIKRVWQHKNKLIPGFTEKYSVTDLVYYEIHEDVLDAITREKQIKKWNRAWKMKLIEAENPGWCDLFESLN